PGSRTVKRVAKEKPAPISQIFFTPCWACPPNSPPRPGGAPHPSLSPRKCVPYLHRNFPSPPLRAPRRFRNPKIGQQLGAQPTPGFRVILLAEIDVKMDAMIDVEIDAVIDPLPPFTFCHPFSFDSKLIW